MSGMTRSSQGLDARRRRLLFRCWHRGMREMDLIMGRFADACVGGLSEAELDEFEKLIELPDAEVFAWVCGDRAPPAQYNTALFQRIRNFPRERDVAT